jgi:uncharacterized protein
MSAAPSWQRGQTTLVRYVFRGELHSAYPVVVVEDTAERLILFTPMGSLTQRGDIDLATGRFETVRPHVWHTTDSLKILEPGAGFSISAMYRGGGGPFICWYIDLLEPWRRAGGGIVTWDLTLDIVAAPDLSWRMKDEDHFARIQELGWVTPEQARGIRRNADHVVARIESKAPPFNEPWPDWRPDPSWPMPVLPEDWARVPD